MRKTDSLRLRVYNIGNPVTSFYDNLFAYWHSKGWSIEVFISKNEYRIGRDSSWKEKCEKIHYTPNFGIRGKNLGSKMFSMLMFVLYASLKSLFIKNPSCNIFLTQPPLFHCFGWVLKVLKNQKYMVVLMDLYPDVAIEAGVFGKRSILSRILGRISLFGLQRSDGVVVIGSCMASKLLNMGIDPGKIHNIPNWTDVEKIVCVEHNRNAFRLSINPEDRFLVLYSGNMGVSHHFSDILEVALRMKDEKNILFVFIGNGARKREIEKHAIAYNIDNIRLVPFRDDGKLSESLGSADLHFVSLKEEFTGLVVPSKVYNILASGRPVLYQGSQNGEVAKLITEARIGKVIKPGCPDEMESCIRFYMNNREYSNEQGERARKFAETVCCKDIACAKYTELLISIIYDDT